MTRSEAPIYMNLRRAAALALVGWYLMVPPPVGSNFDSFDKNAPLSKWRQPAAFDSAAACEQYRTEAIDTFQKRTDANGDYNVNLYIAGRCVTSDDPRLKGK